MPIPRAELARLARNQCPMTFAYTRLCSALVLAAICPCFTGAALASPPSIKPPARPKPNIPPAYALGPPAAIAIETDKDNGGSVTLPPDTTLIVRLRTTLATQNAWNLLLPPNLPLHLNTPPRHTDTGDEFRFLPHYLPGKTQTFFLRFVYVDPRLPAINAAHAWHIKVIVPPSFVEPGHTLSLPTLFPSH